MSVDVEYYSFSPKRADQYWDSLRTVSGNVDGDMDTCIELDLEHGSITLGEEFFAHDLGGVEPYITASLQNALAGEYVKYPEAIEGTFGRQFLLELFTSINDTFISDAVGYLMKRSGWEEKDSRDAIMIYLRSARGVAKDLKDTEDSIFISMPPYDYGSASQEVIELLETRAEKHRDIVRKQNETKGR